MAFTGEGARRYGGRWNSPGVPAIYTASSLALGLLEVMANARRVGVPPGYAYCEVDIPDDIHTEHIDIAVLPVAWHVFPAPPELQSIGDAWLRAGEAVALFVPSAIVRIEPNVILNPAHADFARLRTGPACDLPVDDRLRSF